MIHDLDASLRALVRRDAINGGDVEVAFDAPTRDWAGKRSKPTINLYLFDIREDVARRIVEPERVLDDDGKVIGRRRPPRRFRLSYLVTAWTQRPEDEHRLLSSVLGTFLPHEELPRDVLQGSLADQTGSIHLTIGLPPPAERSIGEIWSAMGGELKPSLELVLSTPFVLDELRFAGPPVTEQPRFTFDGGQQFEHRQARPFPGPRPTSNGDHPHGDDADGDGTDGTSKGGTARKGSSGKGAGGKGSSGKGSTGKGAGGKDGAGGTGSTGSRSSRDEPLPSVDDIEETVTGGEPDGAGRVITISSFPPHRTP